MTFSKRYIDGFVDAIWFNLLVQALKFSNLFILSLISVYFKAEFQC